MASSSTLLGVDLSRIETAEEAEVAAGNQGIAGSRDRMSQVAKAQGISLVYRLFDFAELVKRFPESRYAKDAGLRMLFLRNNLAQYEMHVADYYMRRGAYVAAANRAKQVIENYQGTPAVPQALVVLVQAYRKLGLDDLAADAERVLKLNYPERAAEI